MKINTHEVQHLANNPEAQALIATVAAALTSHNPSIELISIESCRFERFGRNHVVNMDWGKSMYDPDEWKYNSFNYFLMLERDGKYVVSGDFLSYPPDIIGNEIPEVLDNRGKPLLCMYSEATCNGKDRHAVWILQLQAPTHCTGEEVVRGFTPVKHARITNHDHIVAMNHPAWNTLSERISECFDEMVREFLVPLKIISKVTELYESGVSFHPFNFEGHSIHFQRRYPEHSISDGWLGGFHPKIYYGKEIDFAVDFEVEEDGTGFRLTGFTGIPMHLERFHEFLLEHTWGWEGDKLVSLEKKS